MKLGTLDEIKRDMESGIWDFTKDGECSNCGQCCSDFLPVSEKEIQTIRRYIKRNNIKEQIHFLPTARPIFDMTCPFRNDRERRCDIYEVRPAICRDFQCDKPRKQIEADKAMYHGKYGIVSMRAVFFPKKTTKGENKSV